jgi:uncharacterized protein
MLILISPAKSLDYTTPLPKLKSDAVNAQPAFMSDSAQLIQVAKQLSEMEIAQLMDISPALAQLNKARFMDWSPNPAPDQVRPAAFAFNGDVYDGLDVRSLSAKNWTYLQDHLRILSGLYGVLSPFDALQPYRLEMGRPLQTLRGKNLYAFWDDKITQYLNALLAEQKQPVIVNLASEEYFKSVKTQLLAAKVITPVFEDWKGGKYKIISFHAKRARGLMARYCALRQIKKQEKMKAFDLDGYQFNPDVSDETRWVFQRRIAGVD